MLKIYHFLLATILFTPSLTKASYSIDSIGVEIKNGKKVIVYKVDAKETYYSIAKKYNITHFQLMEFNDSKLLQIGETIKIPTQINVNSVTTEVANIPTAPVYKSNNNSPILNNQNRTNLTDETEIIYTVKAKDNLNLIAKLHGTTVEQLKELNNLSSNNLQIGQVLKIRTNASSNSTISNNTRNDVVTNNPTTTIEEIETTLRPITRRYKATVSHKVKSGETLGHIAQKYDMSVDAIKKLNKLKSTNLQIGQALKVEVMKTETTYQKVPKVVTRTSPVIPQTPAPTSSTNSSMIGNTNNSLAENTPTINSNIPTVPNSTNNFEHTVIAGETIYSIAKKYNLTTYQLTTANNLTSNNLSVGQKLIIKGSNQTQNSVAVLNSNTNNTLDDETLNDPKLKQPASKFGLTRYDEKGTAVWITDPDLDETKMLVLHRTAPIGTIIRITNPMTNRSAFAKVVGKFTENETTKDVIIVLTKMVAEAVGALDKRFYCNINYGAVDNE
ncbi:MAG: LysM peptidoglycan-binding domain-containing protein [Pedobacter sp.]|nr:MAG: LysM peptidoglycan-binding domain-containing protein [Pedobacter sp.]